MSNSIDPNGLAVKFDIQRRGVSDPARLVAAELHHITDVLLEILKELQAARKPGG
jgi:hypothetical protein